MDRFSNLAETAFSMRSFKGGFLVFWCGCWGGFDLGWLGGCLRLYPSILGFIEILLIF